MTKRERVLAAIARREVDRPPVAFWRHVPDVDHTSQGLADAIFSPLTIGTKLAGDVALHSIATAPEALRAALEVITETTARYAVAALEAGADGLFFATQAANAEAVSDAVSTTWDLPYARRV